MKARSKRGYGIHSPFVYNFTRKVLFNEEALEVPAAVTRQHRIAAASREVLDVGSFGAGSRVTVGNLRSVRNIVRRSSAGKKQAALLFRLVSWYKPEVVVEFGSGVGISTLYLAAATACPVYSVEGSSAKHAFAKSLADVAGISNAAYICSPFTQAFSILKPQLENKRSIVFIDGDHRYAPTVEMVEFILNAMGDGEALVVIDDIHWSRGMEEAWIWCRARPEFEFTMDLFSMGILVKRDGREKQDFKLTF